MLKAGGYSAMATDPMATRREPTPAEQKTLFQQVLEYLDSREVFIAVGSTKIQNDLFAKRALGL